MRFNHILLGFTHSHSGFLDFFHPDYQGLERTKADLGATETIYAYADVFGFCSAPLSRAAMLEDLMNIRFCPYNIYMYQISEGSPVIIGYDVYPEGTLKDVQALLDDITRSAIGLN